ncbi:BZ3500_MvSof-1268-A1-R1_Chr4-4g07475 [Microbotryum saponariae]|uniref:BZ3500_MvSof-1268-A1-R1_Chr4-4g07475 protein n=1 Tax=Microbotryum saponariae TaxID=289078 RepID=A0A2X0KRH1_9BASI|nr:BZ3500_MvSof-1268-A1-R1_Chr4-4g07475 [Microbotryum saponariae]SDA07136.1 BZ3501_MvSof-1269-A2-R1_Chr4-3g07183 [Microbotryum saponariae]
MYATPSVGTSPSLFVRSYRVEVDHASPCPPTLCTTSEALAHRRLSFGGQAACRV